MPHWEMPLDRHLDRHLEIVKSLAAKHDDRFSEVTADWQQSRAHILDHDRAYWQNRTAPDPADLF